MNRNMVCLVNNMYALLIYLLLKSEDVVNHTYFIFGPSVSKEISKNFKHIYLSKPKGFFRKLMMKLYIRYAGRYRWPFLKNSEFWGQDNLFFSSPIIGNNDMTILEDGLLNYIYKPHKRRLRWLYRIIGGSLDGQAPLGYSTNVKTIYLTGLMPIPAALSEKVRLISLQNLWDKCAYKERILQLFGLDKALMQTLSKYSNIVLTQPLSEDGLMTENEKIELYRDLLKDVRADTVVIKTHPREHTDYKRHFFGVYVLESHIPFELLTINKVFFKDVYTIFSTGALAIPYEVNVHFAGTRVHPNLLRRYGDI